MHSGWLVEMAGLWGYHGATLVCERDPLPVEAVNEYWLRNRIRFDGWNAMLSNLRGKTLSLSVSSRVRAWHKLRSVLEEILARGTTNASLRRSRIPVGRTAS